MSVQFRAPGASVGWATDAAQTIPRTAAGLIEVLPGIGDSGRIVLGDPPEAIEVELSDKSNRRLDEILKGWRWTVAEKKVSRVRYLCAPKALPYVGRGDRAFRSMSDDRGRE